MWNMLQKYFTHRAMVRLGCLLLLYCSMPVYAQSETEGNDACSQASALTWLQQEDAEKKSDATVFFACRQFAVFGQDLIIARLMQGTGENESTLDLYLYRVNPDQGLVSQAYFPAFTGYDAMGPRHITLDAETYPLASGSHAVGLRIHYSNETCRACEGMWNYDELDLFLLKAKKSDWVLRHLRTAEMQTRMAADSRNCVYAGIQSTLSLRIDQRRHAGLRDLQLHQKIRAVPGLRTYAGPECPPQKQRIRKRQLHWYFDGRQYRGVRPELPLG